MRLFSCQSCAQILFFENTRCERCRHALGFWPATATLQALEPAPDSTGDTWSALGLPGRTFHLCANAAHDVCNWLVDVAEGETFCVACRHNRVIPELAVADNRIAWRKIEVAKHRLFYTLERLGLCEAIDTLHGAEPLTFKFMADDPSAPRGQKVMTGHHNGTITIALSEANDAERELRRKLMGEPYRTLLGHFRHEVGHYFWDKLVRDGGKLVECRAVFGDDSVDYKQALKRHYASGPPLDWQQNYVSAYATAHPWEDFAETWAHLLHIVDTMEMAKAYDVKLAPAVDRDGEFAVDYGIDPYNGVDVKALVDVWLPVSTALNSLNMTMGHDELYPFILSPRVITKLGFVHELVRAVRKSEQGAR